MKILVVVALTSFTFTGCKKADSVDDDATVAIENEESESVANDADNMADNAAKGTKVNKTDDAYELLTSPCAQITHDTVAIPHVLTIDFGATDCLCLDGRYRRGKIIISYTGHYFDAGSVRTMTFDGYYVNQTHHEGTRTITNNGLNASGNYTWSIHAVNMKHTKANGNWHQWNSDRTREMTAGYGTPAWLDDVYSITGTADGNNHNGVTRHLETTTPLVRSLNCHWIESGVVVITPSNKPARTLDFGNTGCDANATVTINGHTHNITLH